MQTKYESFRVLEEHRLDVPIPPIAMLNAVRCLDHERSTCECQSEKNEKEKEPFDSLLIMASIRAACYRIYFFPIGFSGGSASVASAKVNNVNKCNCEKIEELRN